MYFFLWPLLESKGRLVLARSPSVPPAIFIFLCTYIVAFLGVVKENDFDI